MGNGVIFMAKTTTKKSKKSTRTKRRLEDSLSAPHTAKPDEDAPDWQRFLFHVRDNPWWYLGGIGFVAVAFFAGLAINMTMAQELEAEATAYAKALEVEDPSIRAEQLEQVAATSDAYAAKAWYMAGEAHYEAGEYDAAAAAFEKVRSEFPGSDVVAEATEGLGYVAEERGEFEAALAYYEEVRGMANAFAAQRQGYNIGRVHERLENYEAARTAYEEQQSAFPESRTAALAAAALNRLRQEQPELFPEEAVDTAGEFGLPGAGTVPVQPGADATPAPGVIETPVPDDTGEVEPAPAPEDGTVDAPAEAVEDVPTVEE